MVLNKSKLNNNNYYNNDDDVDDIIIIINIIMHLIIYMNLLTTARKDILPNVKTAFMMFPTNCFPTVNFPDMFLLLSQRLVYAGKEVTK